jgi:serine/threonine protein kinase
MDNCSGAEPIVGTFPYLLPELFPSDVISYATDWWAVEIIAFRAKFGYSPFYMNDEYRNRIRVAILGFNEVVKIKNLPIEDPLADLMIRLLCSDPRGRIRDEIAAHEYVKAIDWGELRTGECEIREFSIHRRKYLFC